MKCISYVLFGNGPMYLHGAIRNAELARSFYPGWTPVFYVDQETVSDETIKRLQALGAQVRLYSSLKEPNGMFVRFYIADDPEVERFVVRDIDSRPSAREVNAVNAWIESGRSLHIMRDHPFHAVPMLGGLWGATRGVLRNVQQQARAFPRFRTPYSRQFAYGADQEFLWKIAYPRAEKDGLIHDSCTRSKFPRSVPFPDGLKFGDWRFVGEVFDENEQPDPVHWQQRVGFMSV